MPTGTSSPPDNGTRQSTVGVKKSKSKVTLRSANNCVLLTLEHLSSVGRAAVLETGPLPAQDHKSGTVCCPISDYVGCHTASSGGYWRHFYLDSEATAQCELFLTVPNRNILTYLLTYNAEDRFEIWWRPHFWPLGLSTFSVSDKRSDIHGSLGRVGQAVRHTWKLGSSGSSDQTYMEAWVEWVKRSDIYGSYATYYRCVCPSCRVPVPTAVVAVPSCSPVEVLSCGRHDSHLPAVSWPTVYTQVTRNYTHGRRWHKKVNSLRLTAQCSHP